MMGALVPWLLAAMTAWVPVEKHAWQEPRASTEARYLAIASAIEEVALDPSEAPLPLPLPRPSDGDTAGDAGEARARAWTALVLASVASVESYFRRDIETCRIAGDGGRVPAWGLWQLALHRDLACADRRRTAHVALGMIREAFHRCARLAIPERLSFFTQGPLRAVARVA